ncbi:APC family permease [Nonomuraea sp. NPDC050404]|uniref:APC family permease n=1 Tax=Nonomuraea sp. NPDC050404 TaxID=3155783 RepID=UPI0033D03614
MTRPTPTGAGPDPVAGALAANRLGAPSVVYFVLSAAAPLTVVAGVVTTGYAVTGITGLPIAFLVVGVVLSVFAVGYVAMARHMANAGAFYTYISRGLGRPAGIGAAWVALIAYNTLQVALYGAFGVATAPLLEGWLGITPAWWAVSLVAWVLVALLGVTRVDVNGRLLAVLLTAEVAVILLFDLADLINPAASGYSVETLSPSALFVPGVGALLVLATLGFVGFESSVVFSEESKEPRRTVPIATYSSVAIIAFVYALSSWAMTVATGPENIVAVAQRDQADTIFVLAEAHLGPVVVDIARVLFATSVFAAMISFHNTTSRYFFALGRERVLPSIFGRTAARSGAPKAGSIAQSTIGLVTIVLYAVLGLDPLVQLFFYGGSFGGLGVLLLIFVTAVSIIVFFARRPAGETLYRRLIAPVPAAIALAIMVWFALDNFWALLGVPEGDALAWVLPAVYGIAAVLGVVWALVLRAGQPAVYAAVGMGAKAAVAADTGHTAKHGA